MSRIFSASSSANQHLYLPAVLPPPLKPSFLLLIVRVALLAFGGGVLPVCVMQMFLLWIVLAWIVQFWQPQPEGAIFFSVEIAIADESKHLCLHQSFLPSQGLQPLLCSVNELIDLGLDFVCKV